MPTTLTSGSCRLDEVEDGVDRHPAGQGEEADGEGPGGPPVVRLGAAGALLPGQPPGQHQRAGHLDAGVEPERHQAERAGGDPRRERHHGLDDVPADGHPVEQPGPAQRLGAVEVGRAGRRTGCSSRHLVPSWCRPRGDRARAAAAGRPGRAARAPAGRRRAGSAPAGPRRRQRPGRSRAGRPGGWRPPGGCAPRWSARSAGYAGASASRSRMRRRVPSESARPTRSRTARVSAYDGERLIGPTVHRWLNSHQAERGGARSGRHL